MIITVEIEQFCKDIEARLPSLEGKAYDNAKDKLNILNRVSLEFMEYEDLMRKSAVKFLELKGGYLTQKKEILILQEKVKQLEFDLETIKERI